MAPAAHGAYPPPFLAGLKAFGPASRVRGGVGQGQGRVLRARAWPSPGGGPRWAPATVSTPLPTAVFRRACFWLHLCKGTAKVQGNSAVWAEGLGDRRTGAHDAPHRAPPQRPPHPAVTPRRVTSKSQRGQVNLNSRRRNPRRRYVPHSAGGMFILNNYCLAQA